MKILTGTQLAILAMNMFFISASGWAVTPYLEFELPGYLTWCTQVTMSDADAEDVAKQKAARDNGLKVLNSALLSAALQRSGLPYIANVGRAEKVESNITTRSISLDVCVLVPAGTPAPTNKKVVAVPVAKKKIAAKTCPRSTEDKCIADIQAELASTLAKPLATVSTWPWRYVSTMEAPIGPTLSAIALTDASSRPILGHVAVTEYGNLTPPDPKKMRPLNVTPQGGVIVVPQEQGNWITVAVELP